ncbi:MAG TPA: L,D-transpeptidase family protein [Acidobacteriota bacterium]|jgi:murein L,D-transpeptidase YcbB/YkuD
MLSCSSPSRVLLLLGVFAVTACSRLSSVWNSSPQSSPEEIQSVQSALASQRSPEYVTGDDEDIHLWKTVGRFYKLRSYQTAWISYSRPLPQADALIRALQQADREGLDSAAYGLDAIKSKRAQAASSNPLRKGTLDPASVAALDIRFTFEFLKFATHLLVGRIDPEEIDPHWFSNPRKVDLANVLERALDEDRVEDALMQLAPPYPEYAALRDALAHYRNIAAKGGWPKVPENAVIRNAIVREFVPLLRQRLSISGDLSSDAGAATPGPGGKTVPVDNVLEEAIRRFEKRHGLKVDGVADRELIAELNVPVEQRIRQIELNMERWRWLPENLGQRYILVNIPDFQLWVFENGTIQMTMRVVVGKKNENPTPIFSDAMTHIVFSPYWNIPESIARKETIPHILKDPDYLARNNLEVVTRSGQVVDPSAVDWSRAGEDFDYRFRQKPGRKNSLGGVKFMFPNQFNVYLHDTPAEGLFGRVERDLSHGCVRIEKPIDLARYLLRDQPQWTESKIREAMQAGEERTVRLKEPIPVHLLYWTAWVDSDGTVEFREDIYGYDKKQEEILRERLRQRGP